MVTFHSGIYLNERGTLIKNFVIISSNINITGCCFFLYLLIYILQIWGALNSTTTHFSHIS